MGYTRHIGMHTDRHDTGNCFAFTPQSLKLVNTSHIQFLRTVILKQHHRDVVQFHGVRNRQHWFRFGLQPNRLVVQNPIGHVLNPCSRQTIQGVVIFRQTRAFPTHRELARKTFDGVNCRLNRFSLICQLVHRALHKTMTHDFPVLLERSFNDAWITVANNPVRSHGGDNATLL